MAIKAEGTEAQASVLLRPDSTTLVHVYPGESYVAALSHSFLMSKMGIITPPIP